MFNWLWLLVAITSTLAGCTGTLSYIKPKEANKQRNVIILKEEKDVVWDRLISGLGQEFFVINNIDKASGFINVSYSGSPLKYVDCGRIITTRPYDDFPASIGYKEMVGYIRIMELEGRINIIVQANTKSEAIVTVNTKYLVTRKEKQYDPRYWPESETVNFNTNQRAIFSTVNLECVSTGQLEKTILSIVDNTTTGIYK